MISARVQTNRYLAKLLGQKCQNRGVRGIPFAPDFPSKKFPLSKGTQSEFVWPSEGQ